MGGQLVAPEPPVVGGGPIGANTVFAKVVPQSLTKLPVEVKILNQLPASIKFNIEKSIGRILRIPMRIVTVILSLKVGSISAHISTGSVNPSINIKSKEMNK